MSEPQSWHDRWIEVDPHSHGGKPHVRGTSRTVEEVQEFWRRAGVYAAELRKQFPDLSEAQLGAAVTWAPHYDPLESYVADWEGPPRRRFYLHGEPGSWVFESSEVKISGSEAPGDEFWEEGREAILRYAAACAPSDVLWRNAKTGDVVDIYALKD